MSVSCPSAVPAETLHDICISGDIMIHYLNDVPEIPETQLNYAFIK